MKVSSVMSLVLLFALLFSATHSGEVKAAVEEDPLLPICKTVAGGSTYIGIDFCLSALGSYNRSRDTKGYRDFAIIAVDLLTDNVSTTAMKIDGLLHKEGGGGGSATASKCLKSCESLYMDILGRQPGCAAAVESGSFEEAQATLNMSANAVKECEGWFRNSDVASPLVVEDDNAFKLAKLAAGLLDHAT